MKFLISLLAITWFFSFISGKNVILNGPCSKNKIRVMSSFNKEDFMGLWHLFLVTDYDQIKGYDCIKANYELTPDGNGKAKENYFNIAENRRQEVYSVMIFDGNTASYVYIVPGDPSATDHPNIISDDLDEFYIEISCKDVARKCECYSGVYTRKAVPKPKTLAAIKKTLKRHNINPSDLRTIIHGAKCK